MLQPTDVSPSDIVLTTAHLASLETQYPWLSASIVSVLETTREATAASLDATPPETHKQSLVCPPDIPQEKAQSFKKLWLTYQQSSEGHYLCVYEDPKTHEVSQFVYHPQAWVNAHTPKNVTWENDGITSHNLLCKTDIVWHFNKIKKWLATYLNDTLTPHHLTLAHKHLTGKLAGIFRWDMYTAFGIDLTYSSNPDGRESQDVVGPHAGLWLDDGCLYVARDVAWVSDAYEDDGLGLFLQDTSSGT